MLGACTTESSTSQDDDADGGGASGVTSAKACGAYFDALVDVGARCANGALDDDFQVARRDGYIKDCEYLVALPGVPTGVSAKLASCAERLAGLSCEVILGEEDPCDLSSLRGTREGGATCEESVQCATGSCTAGGASCGVCAAEVADGEVCDYRTKVCKTGSSCSQTGADEGICKLDKKAGEACTSNDRCEGELSCEGGTCKAPPKVGQACEERCAGYALCDASVCAALPNLGDKCLGDRQICADGLRCGELSLKCEKRVDVRAALGEPCGIGNVRCEAGYCKGTSSTDGVCTAFGKVGEACDDQKQALCEAGLRCTDKACAELTPICKE